MGIMYESGQWPGRDASLEYDREQRCEDCPEHKRQDEHACHIPAHLNVYVLLALSSLPMPLVRDLYLIFSELTSLAATLRRRSHKGHFHVSRRIGDQRRHRFSTGRSHFLLSIRPSQI